MIAASALVLAVAALFFQTTDATTIPLQKRNLGITQADGAVNLSALNLERAHLISKYQRNTQAVTSNRAAMRTQGGVSQVSKRGTVPLTIQDYAVWTGRVTIGTPAQSFNIYFDTGSSDFTVASSTCGTSCGSKNRYNVAASSTANRTSTTVTTNFVDGTSSSGNLVYDTVTAGSLTAKSQAVIAASSLSSSVSEIQSDGLMGLAYPALSQAYSSSLEFTFYNEGQGTLPYFGLRLSNTDGQSQLTFGGYNRAKVAGYVRYLPVSKDSSSSTFNTYWQIGGSAPFVNGKVAGSRVNHILDSGTTLILAPTSAAATFWANVPGSQQYDTGTWTYPCANAPAVAISFARITLQTYGINPDDFNLGYLTEDPTRCVGAIMGADLGIGSSWILGDTFLLSWYVVHDVKNARIGLATPR